MLDPAVLRLLAARYPGSFFVLDERELRTAHAGLDRALTALFGERGVAAYAIKANPAREIVRTCIDMGMHVHTASTGEARHAMDLGLAPDKVLLNSTWLPADALGELVGQGARVHLDSPQQVETALQLGAQLAGGGIGLRVKADWCMESRFGLAPTDAEKSARLLLDAGIRVTSLHVHCGTSYFPPPADVFGRRAEAGLGIVRRLRNLGLDSLDLNLGGGFLEPPTEAPGVDDYAAAVRSCLEPAVAPFEEVDEICGGRSRLFVEPGRFLVQHAGTLVTRVRELRSTPGEVHAILDVGMCTLPSLYSWTGTVRLLDERPHRSARSHVVFSGPSSMEADVITRQDVDGELRPGDVVAIDRVGAYHMPGGTTFAEPPPAIVWIDAAGTAHDPRPGMNQPNH